MDFATVAKDPKLRELLRAHMVNEHNDECFDFIFSTASNQRLYNEFVSEKSLRMVNLSHLTRDPLEALAARGKWQDMTGAFNAARSEVTAMVEKDVLPRFQDSPLCAKYLAAKAPKPLVPSALDLSAARSAVARMDRDLSDGSAYFVRASATVKAKGVPVNREEVNRMFQSARMRHDKVMLPLTELLQKDKSFTRANFGQFFARKDNFTKLYSDYRKLLGT
jgi:hypothetical protein